MGRGGAVTRTESSPLPAPGGMLLQPPNDAGVARGFESVGLHSSAAAAPADADDILLAANGGEQPDVVTIGATGPESAVVVGQWTHNRLAAFELASYQRCSTFLCHLARTVRFTGAPVPPGTPSFCRG